MSGLDLIIRGAAVVGAGAPERLDVGVLDGRIAALEPDVAGPAREEVGAAGLHLLPGAIDGHVHFNEPGRADWEGWASGTCALAAGGATLAVEMPLNAEPPTVDAYDLTLFEGMRRAAALRLPVAVHAESEALLYRHRHTPYVGRTLRARVARTLVRGATVLAGGRIVSPSCGRLVTPDTGVRP